MPDRDPRTDPRPGDVLRLGAGTWTVAMTSGNPTHSVWMWVESEGNPEAREDNRSIAGYRKLAANAEVVNVSTD